MEIRHLEAFVTVVREGSFTRAAERLNLTQPSLSTRIQHLEQALNGELFNRDVRPMRLTVVGETFLPYAERVLGVLEAAAEAVRIAQSGMVGRLAVGCPVSISLYLMPQVVNQFSQAFPQAELFLETSHSINLVQQLLDGVLDMTFTAVFPHLIHQAEILFRLHDELIAAAPPSHPLTQQSHIPLAQLWAHRLVLPRWGAAFEAYIKSLRDLAADPLPMIRIPLATALPMSQQVGNITFVPRRVASAAGLVPLDIEGFAFGWDMVLITRPGRALSRLEQGFLETVMAVAG